MRLTAFALLSGLLLAPAVAVAAEKPRLELADENLPLWELRPLDRHAFVLTLEGTWNEPPERNREYFVNVFYPNGGGVSHKPVNDALFRKGAVRCVFIEYEWLRNGAARGDKLGIVVSRDRPVGSADAPEVVSNRLELTWPIDRPLARRPPRTRHEPPPPIDDFVPPGEEPEKVPPPLPPKKEPPPVPEK
jgi:hypothetical protein